MSRICLLFALAAMLARAADQPALPPQLTLSQPLDIALSNSTNIRTAMAQLDQVSGRYEQSRSTLLPQLNVRARQDYLTVNLAGIGILVPSAQGKFGPLASMDARAFLTQQVLNLSDIRTWQSSRSREESSRLLVEHARELVALRVVATYLEALKAKASRDALEAQRKLADELYRLTRSRVNQDAAAELNANRAMHQGEAGSSTRT
jgi:outer membrane protein TolC